MICTHCDDGFVEKDVSHGDYMQAELRLCPFCNGTKVLVCVVCDRRDATVIDAGDALCTPCYDGDSFGDVREGVA